jgi:hypothetical protein
MLGADSIGKQCFTSSHPSVAIANVSLDRIGQVSAMGFVNVELSFHF